MNNFFAVQNLKMALKKANILQHTKSFSDVRRHCQTKKLLVCCKMFAFFKAIFRYFLVHRHDAVVN